MIILLSSDPDKRGWDPAYPAFSCKEILRSGHSKGDGEYWIDPDKSGNPLKVYCDMSRYGGEWLRNEDFNRSIFDYDFAMGTSGLNYSCFLYKDPYYIFLIETKTKFSNLIGYHQPADLRTNRAVYASCL